MSKSNFLEIFKKDKNIFEDLQSSGAKLSEFLSNILNDFSVFVSKYIDFITHAKMDKGLMVAYSELSQAIMSHPDKWMKVQAQFYQDFFKIWLNFWSKQFGKNDVESVIKPSPKDTRFRAKEWEENAYLDFIKESYLLLSDFMMNILHEFPLEETKRKKLQFHTRQFLSSISPTNFALTNPDVLQTAIETKGKSLLNGFKNMIEDLKKGRITMTDESKFEVGKNVAITEGAVVFQNELIQLIQYKPLTEKVKENPFLILPPWINKYYILDLTPENSFVKYIVEQGYTVFMVSWKSADASIKHLTWEDYLEKGAIAAIEAVKSITESKKVNTLGFCIGGTLLANTLAILKKKRNSSAHTATFLAAMVDFVDTGEIGTFIDEFFVQQVEEEFKEGGILNGNILANTFASLRENELFWNYVISNYLKGQTPPPFDLLYWNSDPTNLPGKMYAYYIRNMYLENNLIKPNYLKMLGQYVDIHAINTPSCFIATIDDHISPWKTVYKGFLAFNGEKKFILGASGHIAGIVNHPAKKKRNYWVNNLSCDTPEEWLDGATSKPGSWWTEWIEWLNAHNPNEVPAREIKGKIEDAPGSYVKERLAW
jgi:polyhydroxyalkanoate synthase